MSELPQEAVAYIINKTKRWPDSLITVCSDYDEAMKEIQRTPDLLLRAESGEVGILWPVGCYNA